MNNYLMDQASSTIFSVVHKQWTYTTGHVWPEMASAQNLGTEGLELTKAHTSLAFAPVTLGKELFLTEENQVANE